MRIWALWAAVMMWAAAALAQSPDDIVWVQIEAHPSLATATERARSYEGAVEDVNGFAIRRRWYALTLGPYRRADAEQVLRVYRAEGLIPRDAYLAASDAYGQQFWPVGANVLDRGVLEAPVQADSQAAAQAEAPAPDPVPADETPAQARRSEQLLTRAEREELQVALKWAGTYAGAIDGAYGRGTRGAMAAWQRGQGFEETGILTTSQRAELLRQYNAVLDGLGLRLVTDAEAGIEMQLPTDVVSFARYESPFAQYDGTGEVPEARVLLISQPGDRNTLAGLYDIMQTLEIVPLDGPRERGRDSFTLKGENARIVSETRARLVDGAVKGFTLIWPAGDEERRTRLIDEMEKSFSALDAVLDPAAGDDSAQAIDLVSGLAVRRPRLSRSGFFIDDRGTVLTTAEAVQNCTRITFDEETTASVAAEDGGIAVLRPDAALAPLDVAWLSLRSPRLGAEVAVAGYSYEGVLNAPSVTFGTFADVRGLDGDERVARLDARLLPGDAGGPVLDATGAVVGMLLPRETGSRALPEAVALAAKAEALAAAASAAGTAARPADEAAPLMEAPALTARGAGMTVLVSCWD
ncbi:MAG: serine protease [Pseudomonadota bacterium]